MLNFQHLNSNRDLRVLTFNQDLENGTSARQFLASRGFLNLPGYVDRNYLSGRTFGQKLLPMSLLFDTDGRLIGYLAGPVAWNSAAARALIARYLPGPDR